MTIQSPGDAASTAAWIVENWPGLPCHLPTVQTFGFGPCACPGAACAWVAVARTSSPAAASAATLVAANHRCGLNTVMLVPPDCVRSEGTRSIAPCLAASKNQQYAG